MDKFRENELKNCLKLRKRLFEISKILTYCDVEERQFYEELCILYSKRLKVLNDKLNNEFGILSCACQEEIQNEK
jgi:hypothetical protein